MGLRHGEHVFLDRLSLRKEPKKWSAQTRMLIQEMTRLTHPNIAHVLGINKTRNVLNFSLRRDNSKETPLYGRGMQCAWDFAFSSDLLSLQLGFYSMPSLGTVRSTRR